MLREETVEPATLGLLKRIVELPELEQFRLVGGTAHLFKFYHDRYSYDDTFAVIRSMIYFTDAEDDQDPECSDGMTWIKVKKIIQKAFDDYYKRNRN